MKLQSLSDLPHPRAVGSPEYRAIIETILDVTDDVAEARRIAIEFRGPAQSVIDKIDGTETSPSAGIDLSDNVPPGALARIVDSAVALLVRIGVEAEDEDGIPIDNCAEACELRRALWSVNLWERATNKD